jgi:hypothetical protein
VNGGLGALYVTAAIQHIPFSLGATPVTAVDADALPISATVRALLRNNEVRGHLRLPIGFAVRVLGIGPGTATVPQDTHVVLEDNELIGNTFGLIVDAGFPAAGTLRRGDVEVTLRGNVIRGSCQRNLLVAFTRHTGALGLTTNPYLIGSSYRLTLGPDLPWSEAWFRHPAGFGNTLVVDGATIAPGAVTAYDPLAPCP